MSSEDRPISNRTPRSMASSNTRNGGKWTEARFRSFIKGALRSASNRWGPKFEVKKEARIERGVYLCAGYQRKPHKTPATLPPKPGNSRRRQVAVDHIEPIVDPAVGFTTWDEVIDKMFCEKEGLQLLCPDCHDHKTADERKIRNGTRRELPEG